ncbi:MAG: branched-chain amino acid ABC transporter permease, partial [Spirochaetales bacterium]
MQVFIAQIINGLSLGSIYVLLVTGFNLLLLVAMIIHFSYPQVVVFSMYIVWIVLNATGNNLILGIAAGVLSSIALNVLCAPLFQKVMKNRGEVDINATMVLSMAIGMIITDVLSHAFNKGLPIAFPEALTGSKPILRIGLISIMPGQVWSLLMGIIAVGCFFLLLYKTRAGRAFRAIAEDPAGARLVGIPLIKTGFQSYALSGVLGGIIAVLLAMLLHSASPGLGEQISHKVLAVSIVAGLGNLVGGLVIGLALGILEALVQ